MNRFKDVLRSVFTNYRTDSDRRMRRESFARISKRVLAGFAALTLLCLIYAAVHGNYVSFYYKADDPLIKAEDVSVSFRNDGAVYLKDISAKNGIVRVDIGSEGDGDAEVTIVLEGVSYTEALTHIGPMLFRPSNGGFPCWQLSVVAAFVMCAWTFVVIAVEYRTLNSHALFSYRAVFLAGFSVFFFVIAAGVGVILVILARDPTAYGFYKVLSWIESVMYYFAIFSSPAILLFSASLCISNIQLIRKEGFCFVNLLGIILSVLMVAGMLGGILISVLFGYTMSYSTEMYFLNTYYGVFSFMVCLLLGGFIIFVRITRHRPDHDKDYIVILGCAIRDDGTLYPLIRGRVDRAIEFAREQEAAGGPSPVFINKILSVS